MITQRLLYQIQPTLTIEAKDWFVTIECKATAAPRATKKKWNLRLRRADPGPIRPLPSFRVTEKSCFFLLSEEMSALT